MIKISSLTADCEKNPIGLTKPPILRWRISADEPFEQEKFRVRIFEPKNADETGGEMIFDSGEIFGNGISFSCGGKISFKPFTKYCWQTEIFTKDGKSFRSDIGEFMTSVLNRSQWTADIFRKFECMDVLSERKIFEADGKVRKAYIFIAATGEKSNGYAAYINGERIGDSIINPGPMEYMSMRVRGYDITEQLRGKNVINIDHLAGISAVIEIFTDKGEQIIKTDSTWESLPFESPYTLGYEDCYTPTRHHGKYELFDTSKLRDDWYSADGKFESAAPSIPGWGPIKLRYLPTRVISSEVLAPVSIEKSADGYIADFGKIQSGFITLKIHNQKSRVKIQYAEHCENGKISTVQYANEYLPITEYVPHGYAEEEFTPNFTHTSFRYAEIVGLDSAPEAADLTAHFIHSDIDGKSSFETDDDVLGYIYKCTERSYKSNLVHIPTDCPGRERRGWTGDSFAVIDSQCFMYDVYRLYDRWLEDLHDNQRINGWCTVEYPDQTDPCIDLNWPMHIIIVPWTIYEHYGEIDILRKNIDSMERYCELLYEISDNYLFAENLFMYGDWVATDRASGAFIGAAMFYYVTRLLSLAEKELSRFDLSEKYARRAEEIKNAVNAEYLKNDGGKIYYDKNSQSANTLALMFELCPEEFVGDVLKSLIDDITERNAVTVGYIANTWLFRVLARYGRNDLAYRFITDESLEISLAAMVNRLRNETLNESFTNTYDSLNHAFLGGGAASWIYRCYAGIKITKPGYAEYEIEPYFSDKTDKFAISTETPRGKLAINWERKNGEILLSVTAPYGAKGTLIADGKKFNISGGIIKLKMES